MEMAAYEQIKDARGVVERAWKKKVDERQQKFDEKIIKQDITNTLEVPPILVVTLALA